MQLRRLIWAFQSYKGKLFIQMNIVGYDHNTIDWGMLFFYQIVSAIIIYFFPNELFLLDFPFFMHFQCHLHNNYNTKLFKAIMCKTTWNMLHLQSHIDSTNCQLRNHYPKTAPINSFEHQLFNFHSKMRSFFRSEN